MLSSALSLLVACGGSAAGGDAGGHFDAAVQPDAGATDAGLLSDAGDPTDAGEDASIPTDAGQDASISSDAGREPDAGPPPTCDADLGKPCDDDHPCPPGFECQVGRCAPQGRPLCGGFAGASCPAPYVNPCVYFASADFGSCLTRAEQDCACRTSEWLDCGD